MSDPRDAVVKKALSDPKFKAELLKDPKAAVEKTLGSKLSPGLSIKVVEDTASVVHLVLPHAAPPPKGPLDDAALEKVSGGAAYTFQCSGNSSLTMFRVC